MNKENLRMQMLSGIITEGEYKAKLEENKKSLNEHYVAGGIVGVGAINQIPSREKSDYETAFEYFLKNEKKINENLLNEDVEMLKDKAAKEVEQAVASSPSLNDEVIKDTFKTMFKLDVDNPQHAEYLRNLTPQQAVKMLKNSGYSGDLGMEKGMEEPLMEGLRSWWKRLGEKWRTSRNKLYSTRLAALASAGAGYGTYELANKIGGIAAEGDMITAAGAALIMGLGAYLVSRGEKDPDYRGSDDLIN